MGPRLCYRLPFCLETKVKGHFLRKIRAKFGGYKGYLCKICAKKAFYPPKLAEKTFLARISSTVWADSVYRLGGFQLPFGEGRVDRWTSCRARGLPQSSSLRW